MNLYALMAAVTVTLNIMSPAPDKDKSSEPIASLCTGVYVAPHYVLSAAHCAEKLDIIKIDDEYPAEIVWRNSVDDLVLLKIDGPAHAYAKLGTPPHIGDKVYTVNSGAGFAGTYNEGMIANRIIDGKSGITPTLLHTAMIMKGASGGGLFNDKGELIGIHSLVWQDFAESTDIIAINYFLDRFTLSLQNDATLRTHAILPSWLLGALSPFRLVFPSLLN